MPRPAAGMIAFMLNNLSFISIAYSRTVFIERMLFQRMLVGLGALNVPQAHAQINAFDIRNHDQT